MFILLWLVANWIQVVGVLTGAASVYFLARNMGKTGWIFGIINAAFFTVLMFQSLLFADVALNLFYLVTSTLGLWWWMKGKDNKPRPITHLSKMGYLGWAIAAIIGTVLFGTFLGSMTIAQFVWIDSFTTVLSFIGQYLLARKIFDNWYVWILADIIDVGLYAVKGLWMVSGLTVVYGGLCVMAIFKWRKDEAIEITESDDTVPFYQRLAEQGAS